MMYSNFKQQVVPNKVCLVDLDGALFDDSHRRHYLLQGNRMAYSAAALLDSVSNIVVKSVTSRDYDSIVIGSGRYADIALRSLMQLPTPIVNRIHAIGFREGTDCNVSSVDIKLNTLFRFITDVSAWALALDMTIDVYDNDERVFPAITSALERTRGVRIGNLIQVEGNRLWSLS